MNKNQLTILTIDFQFLLPNQGAWQITYFTALQQQCSLIISDSISRYVHDVIIHGQLI